ncbi:MAG TPA: MetQ/NlpA family ABC transporter substrate-binding protein [Marinospirillum sp.]|uniref:MetQ/NlpA family ABC transporter substrate-binding protein n=1 Tax=Marinospirillum sp. TaxID=2183934 RepID=UPI002B48DF6D|nr:MetQ/NlpA family ABC transporter substrate-binding protein [Marinospirillum sp.]HKM15299.1 MetQ/NlpA family ABC transporter substrate-binding protein [Marinospirillum sp.]
MKKILTGLAMAAAVTAQVLTAQALAGTLKVAATAVPHAEILEFLKPSLAKQGVTLDVKVFTDYVQPNTQVNEGRLDANFFQHQPYLTEFNKSRGTQLISVVGVHVEPFGAYSTKHKKLTNLPERAQIALPNDATNGGRALLLLQKAGLIKLNPEAGITATPRDIIENPKKLRFKELEAATLPRILGQVDLALINTNYALEAGLNPAKDALIIEGRDSPYVNILVVKEGTEQNPDLVKLIAALKTPAVSNFINITYKGAIAPIY